MFDNCIVVYINLITKQEGVFLCLFEIQSGVQ